MNVKQLVYNILPYCISKKFFNTKTLIPKEFYDKFETVKFALCDNGRFVCSSNDIMPRLSDGTPNTYFEPHYTYHPAWAARILASKKPYEHIDISSYLHFNVIVSAFINVKFYDYRPAKIKLSNFSSEFADLTNLPFSDNSIESLSCMHVVEHIGLERYGDRFDPKGDIKSCNELIRVLKQNGDLLFVVPVGKVSKICYNAHRIYSYAHIINIFSKLKLLSFSLVRSNRDFIENASPDDCDTENCGCGCFHFTKI